MLRNTLIALTAAGAAALALAPAAQAKTNIDFNIGFGINPGVYAGVPVYLDGGYDDDCQYVTVKHKKWNKSHTKKVVFYTKELVCY